MNENACICPHCFTPFTVGQTKCFACGQSVENHNPHGTLPRGTIIAEQYVIASFLAVDGEGVVYRAFARPSKEPVQIKEYLPITLAEDRAKGAVVNAKKGSGVMFKTTRMDFTDLYHALKNVTPARGLHQVLDVVQDNNTSYAVLAPLHGMPLSDYLKATQGNRLSPEAACNLLKDVFEGVEALHAEGLVHRGISPENIVVQAGGEVCLTSYATIGLRTIGSAMRPQLYEGYSAPEQYAMEEFEGRYTDVYCLAAVCYYLVTGQAPVSAGQRLVVDSNPSARSLCASVPRVFSDMLTQALCLRPAERIQTVGNLASCLSSPEEARDFLLAAKRAKQNKVKIGFTGIVGIALVTASVLVCLLAWLMISQHLGWFEEPELEQEPEPTTTVAPTPEPTYVDDFTGLLYSQLISTTVYNDKYLFYVAEEQYSDEVAGTVIGQTPAAGEALGTDVTVQLVISKGPEMVDVPQIFGFTQESASAELAAAGLTASFVMEVNDGSYVSGCVIKTDPEAGTSVQTGTTVTVYIAADRGVSVSGAG